MARSAGQQLRKRLVALAAAVGCLFVLGGCSGHAELDPVPGTTPSTGAVVAAPPTDGELPGRTAFQWALSASRTYFSSSSMAVLSSGTPDDDVRSASLAITLGVPALVAPASDADRPELVAELERLGVGTVLVVGEDVDVPDVSEDYPMLRVVAAPLHVVALQVVIGHDLLRTRPVSSAEAIQALGNAPATLDELIVLEGDPDEDPGEEPSAGDLSQLAGLPTYVATVREKGAVLVAGPESELAVPVGTARAAGVEILVVSRGEAPGVAQAAGLDARSVMTLGATPLVWGTAQQVAYRTRVAAVGSQLPGGGLDVLPGKTYLAMRGLPGVAGLGPLEDGVSTAVSRLRTMGTGTGEAVPTVELVATVALPEPGPEGAYTSYQSLEVLRSAVAEATEVDAMAMLAFQSGRQSMMEQVQAYAELLAKPGVGVVLEPQWRLGPEETPAQHSGHIGDSEVAQVTEWLADFVREHSLPPKLLVVRSPADRAAMVSDRIEVAVVVEIDGAAVVPEVVAQTPEEVAVPGVSAQDVWDAAVVPGPEWWGWVQGEHVVPLSQVLALDPEPVWVRYREQPVAEAPAASSRSGPGSSSSNGSASDSASDSTNGSAGGPASDSASSANGSTSGSGRAG